MKPSESWAMTADGAALRGGSWSRHSGYAARGELALRQALEDVLRQRLGGDRQHVLLRRDSRQRWAGSRAREDGLHVTTPRERG